MVLDWHQDFSVNSYIWKENSCVCIYALVCMCVHMHACACVCVHAFMYQFTCSQPFNSPNGQRQNDLGNKIVLVLDFNPFIHIYIYIYIYMEGKKEGGSNGGRRGKRKVKQVGSKEGKMGQRKNTKSQKTYQTEKYKLH